MILFFFFFSPSWAQRVVGHPEGVAALDRPPAPPGAALAAPQARAVNWRAALMREPGAEAAAERWQRWAELSACLGRISSLSLAQESERGAEGLFWGHT